MTAFTIVNDVLRASVITSDASIIASDASIITSDASIITSDASIIVLDPANLGTGFAAGLTRGRLLLPMRLRSLSPEQLQCLATQAIGKANSLLHACGVDCLFDCLGILLM